MKKAVGLGASDIWFTDHAPFPGDPFGLRMEYAALEEYLSTLSGLKRRYSDIRIHIGLETEYFPHFDEMGYYRYLRSLPDMEILLLGQHMAEMPGSPPAYSFSESEEFLKENEYKLLGRAIVQGINTGYFGAVAHPDRIFRRRDVWSEDTMAVSSEIIKAASAVDIPLEMNLSSVESQKNYKPQFWQLVPDNTKRLIGFDAHYLNEMETRYIESDERISRFME